jgi:hypothetical protein
MDKELQEYYEHYFDLFASKGWKQFIEDMESNREALSDMMTVKDANELFFRKGQLHVLNTMLNFKETIEAAYEENV